MFDFEKLHQSHKAAYIDGVLCGVAVTLMVKAALKNRRRASVLTLVQPNEPIDLSANQ